MNWKLTDLFGVIFEGNPALQHFLLSENWPEGVYPLRKDVKANEVKLNPSPARRKSSLKTGRKLKFIIGPQHPALLEPEKFAVTVDGEIVTKVEPRLGYVHRGIEKSAEIPNLRSRHLLG